MSAFRSDFGSAFWWLPVRLQRVLYPVLSPEGFKRFETLKHSTDEKGYSLEPFIRHRCIFVHIPKCAGRSVSQTLFGNLGGGHTTAMKYRLIFGQKTFREYFKFTFVRNPWDRAVSAFHFLKKGGMNLSDEEWAEKNLARFKTFDQFAKEWIAESNVNTEIHFREQHRFICEFGVAKPIVDFIGRLESIGKDYSAVCEKLGIEKELKTLKETEGGRGRYQEYYSRESAEIVGRVYKTDIDLFGYTFGENPEN